MANMLFCRHMQFYNQKKIDEEDTNIYSLDEDPEGESYDGEDDASLLLNDKYVEGYPLISKELKTKTSKNLFCIRYHLVKNSFSPIDIFYYYKTRV